MEKISVIIITNDEEDSITDCLKSVQWADEIILVDSGSKDRTIELAKKYTSKIFFKAWEGFSAQKKYALSLASNEWVLSLDADERVSEPLMNEIFNLELNSSNGFYLPRENYFINKKISTCGWNKDNQLRLFKKSKTMLTDKLVHEGFVVDGKVDYLKNPLIHYTFRTISGTLSKINYYSTLRALEIFKGKRKITALTIVSHSFSAFFRFFFSLKGYKDGMYGFLISIFNSLTTLLVYSKTWELQKNTSSTEQSLGPGRQI
ncbi:MAG TPA: glycosyltransferase family 2 protein [Ignavibacteriaceae bacterium]|nr:glycosyltransferase family 2 protein [Ignavibacteriaceae bacterium]